MSVSGRASRSGAEYVMTQTMEAYSREVVMPQGTCRNGFGEAEKGAGEIRLTEARNEQTCICEKERKRQRGYF